MLQITSLTAAKAFGLLLGEVGLGCLERWNWTCSFCEMMLVVEVDYEDEDSAQP